MHRRRPGRRSRSLRLPVTSAILGVTLAAGCSSGGGSGSAGPTSPPSPVATSTQVTSASPPAIGLPSPTSTAVRRHVTRPTGARRLTANACSSAAFAVEEVLIGLRILFKNAKISPQLAKDNMTGMAETARRDRAAAAAMRRHWLAAGYPATFPTVRDIDAMIAAIDELRVAIGSKDLAATPRIYLALNSASVQYTNDVTAELCFPS